MIGSVPHTISTGKNPKMLGVFFPLLFEIYCSLHIYTELLFFMECDMHYCSVHYCIEDFWSIYLHWTSWMGSCVFLKQIKKNFRPSPLHLSHLAQNNLSFNIIKINTKGFPPSRVWTPIIIMIKHKGNKNNKIIQEKAHC